MRKKISVRRTVTTMWGIALLAVVFAGCTTTVSFQTQRPPHLDTLGIQRIAVMPFSSWYFSSLQRDAAFWLTNESLARIRATNRFTMISSSLVEQTQRNKGNVESLVDALFRGEIISLNVRDGSYVRQRKGKDGSIVKYTVYTREVELVFSYHIMRTKDGSITGPIRKKDSISSEAERRRELPSPESMVRSLISKNLASLGQDIAPYTVTEYRTLMNETSKDNAVQQRAKDAAALVKSGDLRSAQNAFLGIYRDTGSFAAAYNAGIIIEAMGDLEGALAFMHNLYGDTGNQKARNEVARIENAINNRDLFAAYQEVVINE